MQTTLTPGITAKLTGFLLAFMLILSATGCGGGGNGNSSSTQDPATDKAAAVVARTGPILAVRVGETAFPSDNNSFASPEAPLSYFWSFASKPDGSNAVMSNATSTNPSFIADVWGSYRAQLVVSSGSLTSERAIQLVVATVSPERPTGPFNHQGLSSNCVNCHSDGVNGITPKVGNHVATTNDCATCHTPLDFTSVAFVDHQEVVGNCSQCHNNVVAIGKSEFHAATNAECSDCHNTIAFLELEPDGSFDHSGISRSCSGCHNGTISQGKTPTPADNPPGIHPVTNSECGYCHTVLSFLGAYPDHSSPAVTSVSCDSCHGAALNDQPSDPPPGHPVMTRIDSSTVDCGTCHSIVTFSLDGVFNHALVDPLVMTCETCHDDTNSINAPGKASAVPAHLVTTTDCGACHSTDLFSPAFDIDHTDPAILSLRCDSCHNGTDATGLPPSTPLYAHMPFTNKDCKDCHTPGTFTTGTFDHVGVVGCNVCHDNRTSVGKLSNHIPTNPDNQDCAACHNTIDFADVVFTHAGIDVNNCMLCHDGNIATGKVVSTHLPTTQNCFECHNYTDPAFKPASLFAHSGINANCESCHSGSVKYVTVGAIGKKSIHIPALEQCSVCHDTNATSPGDFSPAPKFLSAVHDGITNGCAGCHISKFLPLPSNPGAMLVKDGNHLPTNQDCDVCHTVAAGFATSNFAHLGITGNCVSCHDGSYDPDGPNAPLGPSGKEADLSGHVATNADCGACHGTDSFKPAFAIDHTDPAVLAARCDSCHTGLPLGATGKDDAPTLHVPTTQDCGVCHVAGGTFSPAIFDHSGIVDNCVSCHDGTIATGTAAKTNPPHITIPNDINTGMPQDCSVCHNPTAFANATFNHQGITNNCVSCHNGTTATGKDTGHVPTNQDCVACHQTTSFTPATFDHVGIVDNCASCHAAGFATPKNVGHVPTNQDCGVCHTPATFKPATFDHTGITNNCVSCHDGNTATGMVDAVPAHIPTSLDCSSCHTTATFAGATWTHDASSVNNCDSCHSPGNGATPKSVGHLTTNEQCDVCHTTNKWAPTNFAHDPNGNYPGKHRRDPGCNGCHTVSIGAGITIGNYPNQLQYAPTCAGCHTNDFSRENDHNGGNNGTVAQNMDCSGGGRGCHKVGDAGF